VSVRVNDVAGVGGFLSPGNFVDVIHTSAKTGARGSDQSMSELLEENIKVLAVDQIASAEQDKPVVAKSVTLEVTPVQAEHIIQATADGSIQLVLRNPTDKSSTMAVHAPPSSIPVPEPGAAEQPVVTTPRPPVVPIAVKVLIGQDLFSVNPE
jgi:pilus assembly protein CpaB